jgi:hypothetical protein
VTCQANYYKNGLNDCVAYPAIDKCTQFTTAGVCS